MRTRISSYPTLPLPGGVCLRLAHTRTARLLSLRRTKLSASEALVLPHRTKVNTVAFRERVDVIFVDKQWLPIYTESACRAGASCTAASRARSCSRPQGGASA
jgi:hypothetical protein